MLNTRDIAAEYRLNHWAGIMRERADSGQSIKSYCEMQGIHENVYYYWQRKLREAACKKYLPKNQNQQLKPSAPTQWAICEAVTPEEPIGNAVRVEIGKFRITLNHGDDIGLFTKACRALELL